MGQPSKPMMGQPRRDKDKKQFVIPKTEKPEREPDPVREMSGPVIKQEILPMGEVVGESVVIAGTVDVFVQGPGDIPDFLMGGESPDDGVDEWGEQRKRRKKEKKKRKHKDKHAKHRRKDKPDSAR